MDITKGAFIFVPGQTSAIILDNEGDLIDKSAYPYVTNDKWIISCYTPYNKNNEGFKAIAPDGTIYFFDELRERDNVHTYARSGGGQPQPARSRRSMLYVSRIEDRFGNYVTYKYNSLGLESITSNDGRKLVISYDGSVKILTVNDLQSDTQRIWRYYVDDETNEYIVERPDLKKWRYSLFVNVFVSLPDKSACPIVPQDDTMTVSHPDGAIGVFSFNERNDYYTLNSTGDSEIRCSRILNLTEKKINGTGIVNDLVWKYNYSNNIGGNSWTSEEAPEEAKLQGTLPDNVDAYTSDTITIVNPDASEIKYYFDRQVSSWLVNQPLAVEHYDEHGALVKQEQFFYQQATDYGEVIIWNVGYQKALLNKIIIKENGNTYTKLFSSFNLYGVSEKRHEFNSFSSDVLHVKNSYLHDVDNWVLNLPAKTELSPDGANYTEVNEVTYQSVSYTKPALRRWYFTRRDCLDGTHAR